MYIFAGRFKGRRLFFPPSPTKARTLRPTTGLVRRALFDILAPRMSGNSFLDLYAGTGAVGLEAISRGAGKVILVESNPDTAVYLKKNLELVMAAAAKEGEAISEKNLRFYPYSAEKAIAVLSKKGDAFDIVFADPPYNFSEEKITEIITKIIGPPPLAPYRRLSPSTGLAPPAKGGEILNPREGGILNPEGILILQHISGLEKRPLFQKGIANLARNVKTRRYGYTSLSFFYAQQSGQLQ